MSADYVINRFKIRGIRPAASPHAACPICYLDATSTDTAPLIEFTCPRGHAFIQTRSSALEHATFLARYVTSSEANR